MDWSDGGNESSGKDREHLAVLIINLEMRLLFPQPQHKAGICFNSRRNHADSKCLKRMHKGNFLVKKSVDLRDGDGGASGG